MTALLRDFFYFISQFYGLLGVLPVELILLLRHILGLHLLKLVPIEPENLTIVLRPDDSVGKLPVKQFRFFSKTQVRLSPQRLRI